MDAEYFANANLSGTPAFTRRDIRINFDWGTVLPVGGSTAPGYRDFPRDNFSVRWTGRIVPRFSETYSFTLDADDGARLFIKATNAPAWTSVIDAWSTPGISSAALALTAGETYDLKAEYRELTGVARCILRWASPSTPDEVIEPLGSASLNITAYMNWLYADAFRCRGPWKMKEWTTPGGVLLATNLIDAGGWPLADARVRVQDQTHDLEPGRYVVQFRGRATVSMTDDANAVWLVGAARYTNQLPAGAGYDAGSNLTTAEVQKNSSASVLQFVSTQRTPGSPTNSGVSAVKFMRPLYAGATTAHELGVVAAASTKRAMQNYVALRFYRTAWSTETNWHQRVLPSYYDVQNLSLGAANCWEDQIMFANETGRDVYLCTGVTMDHDYYTKLAQLVQYGSDGTNPYTATVANPVYPPLNPNLRVYVEYGNETVWNYFGGQITAASREAVQGNTPDGLVINYDGTATDGNAVRYHALQNVRISQKFREVVGDELMNDRARVIMMGQYGGYDHQYCGFIDLYFNNGAGVAYVADPRPVSYYVWGGGGATYYGTTDPWGTAGENGTWISNASFEQPDVPAGTAVLRPLDAGWSFSGNAGICDVRCGAPLITNQTLGALAPPAAMWVGFKFTVGPQDIYAYDIGRWYAPGNAGSHSVRILNASGATMGGVSVALSGAGSNAYVHSPLYTRDVLLNDYLRPIRLLSNQTYYVMSQESASGDRFHGDTTAVHASPDVTIDGAATWTGSGAAFTLTAPGAYTFGPVNFRYTRGMSTADGFIGAPPDNASYTPAQAALTNLGAHCAFLCGTGVMQQTFFIPTPGGYGLMFRAAGNANVGATSQNNALDVYLDGQMLIQDFRCNQAGFVMNASRGFMIDEPGMHTVTFVGRRVNAWAFLDDVMLASADAIYGGPGLTNMPSPGRADGEIKFDWPRRTRMEAQHMHCWGLHFFNYEGGMSGLVPDGMGTPFHAWLRHYGPRTYEVDVKALRLFQQYGGRCVTVGTYDQWDSSTQTDMDNALSFPLLRSVVDCNNTLPVEADNGAVVPCALTPADARTWGDPSRPVAQWETYRHTLTPYAWMSWNIVTPAAGIYSLTADTGTGGTVRLTTDEWRACAEGSSGGLLTGTNWLSQGIHSVKLKSLSGECRVNQLIVLKVLPDGNREPIANADIGQTMRGVPVTINVLDNDIDVDGDALGVCGVTSGAHGSVMQLPAAVRYMPDAGWAGTDTFTYAMTDGRGATNSAAVTVVVMDAIAGTGGGLEPFNGLPFTGAWVSWSGTWASPALDNDGNTIIWNFTLANQHTWFGDCLFLHDPGVAEAWAYLFNGVGTLTLPVRAHTTGTPEMEVWINGNLSGTTGIIPSGGSTTLVMQVHQPGIVKVNLKQVIGSGRAYIDNVAWTGYVTSNEPPIAFDDSFTTPLNTAVQVPAPGVLTNDYTPRALPLWAVLTAPPQAGELQLGADGAFVYTPSNGWVGTALFGYRASDGVLTSDTATVTIAVLPEPCALMLCAALLCTRTRGQRA